MQIIPVLDLMGGVAVHAVRGERARYAPVAGVLGSGESPLALAQAYRDVLGCTQCYVADLDAIVQQGDNTSLVAAIAALGLELWVDAGVADAVGAQQLLALGVARIIVGSESLTSTAQLRALIHALAPQQLVLSVDLKGGVLRAPAPLTTPSELVALAHQLGITQIILLDLARVGAAAGPPLDLLLALRPQFPGVQFYAGGGVRGPADLDALRQAGAAGALVATALHRGALTARSLGNSPTDVKL
jgi:HisA/HisF family protein